MMELLVYALLLGLSVIVVIAVRKAPLTPLGRPLISAYTVVLGMFALYFFMPALALTMSGGDYVWLPHYSGYDNIALTLFVCIAGLVCFLGAYWIRQRATSCQPVFSIVREPTSAAVALAWAMIVFGILLKIFTLYAAGGIEGSSLRLSGGVSAALEMDQVSSMVVFLRFLSGMADASIVWLILYQLQVRRISILSILLLVAILGLSFYGTGKRVFLLWPLLAVGIGFHYYARPLTIKIAPWALLLVVLGGFASLMFRIYLPAYAAGFDIDLYKVSWAGGSILRFYFMSLEFSFFEVLTLAIQDSDRIIRLFGDPLNAFFVTNIEPLSYFVPRVFWPDKPDAFLDMSHAYRVFVLGGDLTSGGGVAGSLLATSWSFAGPIGVAIAMMVLGYLAASIDTAKRVLGSLNPNGVIWYALGIITVFHLFRQGTLGWVVIIVVIQQLGIFAAFALLSTFDRVPAARRRALAQRQA